MSQSKITTNHEEIKQWVERRGGFPASVSDTGKDEPGILRIDFPGGTGDGNLQRIDWDVFFKKFDENRLAFLYQDEVAEEKSSRFFKFINRDERS